MDFTLNYIDFIMLYKQLFQDKNCYWLYCREKASVKLCRCLDLEELNIAMLWINEIKGEIKIEDNECYIVNIFDKHNNFEKDVNISLCSYGGHPTFIKNVKDSSTCDFIQIFSTDYKSLFILLYIYRANINICRSSILEFYFADKSKEFCSYLKKLAGELETKKLEDVILKKHVKLIKKVFHLYANEDARIELFRENDEYENDIYDGINCYGFNQKIGDTTIDRSRVKKKLDENCLHPFVINNLNINCDIIKNLNKTAQKIKEKNGMGKFQRDMNDIYENLEKIIIKEKRTSENKIKHSMKDLREIIDSQSYMKII